MKWNNTMWRLNIIFILVSLLLLPINGSTEILQDNVIVGISYGGSKKFFDENYKVILVNFTDKDINILQDKAIGSIDNHIRISRVTEYWYTNTYIKNKATTDNNNWLVGACGDGGTLDHGISYFNDNNSVAVCSKYTPNNHDETILKIYNIPNKKLIYESKHKERIESISWSPDGKYIALLLRTTSFGLWPHELLFMIAGHPVPYNSFYIWVIDFEGKSIINKFKVASGLKCGDGKIIWSNNNNLSFIDKK